MDEVEVAIHEQEAVPPPMIQGQAKRFCAPGKTLFVVMVVKRRKNVGLSVEDRGVAKGLRKGVRAVFKINSLPRRRWNDESFEGHSGWLEGEIPIPKNSRVGSIRVKALRPVEAAEQIVGEHEKE